MRKGVGGVPRWLDLSPTIDFFKHLEKFLINLRSRPLPLIFNTFGNSKSFKRIGSFKSFEAFNFLIFLEK